MRVAELKRYLPSWVRSSSRSLAFRASAPFRARGLLPGEILSADELATLDQRYPNVLVTTERVRHTWPDPTHHHSPVQSPPRPVDTTYSTVRCAGDDGWRFEHNHTIAPDGRVLYETNLETASLGSAFRLLDRDPRRVKGTMAYLSNSWPTNFFHWMVLTLPLVERYRDIDSQGPDWYYIGESPTSWQLESLALAGIAPEKLLTGSVTADELWSVTPTRIGGGLDPAMVGFTRALVGADELAAGDRRLFLERGTATTRRFLNEDSCFEAIKDLGFERISTAGLSLADEIAVFAEAGTVVSCHGSALTNLLFAPNRPRVLELMPYGLDEPANHTFQELVAAAHGTYAALEGGEPGGAKKKAIDRDLVVDIQALRLTTEAIL